MLKSLHSSKSYCECSTTNKKTENEENLISQHDNRKILLELYPLIRARHVFYFRIYFGGNAVSIHFHGAPCAHGNPTTMHRETRTGGAKRKERGAQQAVRAH